MPWFRPLRSDMALEEAVQSHVVFSADGKLASYVTKVLLSELLRNNISVVMHRPISLWSLIEHRAELDKIASSVYNRCDLLNIEVAGKRYPIWAQGRMKLLH